MESWRIPFVKALDEAVRQAFIDNAQEDEVITQMNVYLDGLWATATLKRREAKGVLHG